jgi:hypothetical protein
LEIEGGTMKLQVKIALVTGAIALTAGPTALAAGRPEGVPASHPGAGSTPEYTPPEPTPGPKAGLPEKAKAYGRYCKGESRKHVKGEKGTPFSRCVKAAAKLRRHEHEEEGTA